MALTSLIFFTIAACTSLDAQTTVCHGSGDSVDEYPVSLLQKQIEVRSAHTSNRAHDKSAHRINLSAMGITERLGGDASAVVMFHLISFCILSAAFTFMYVSLVSQKVPKAEDDANGAVMARVLSLREMLETRRRSSLAQAVVPDPTGVSSGPGCALEDIELLDPDDMDEDLYGCAITSICRDLHSITFGTGSKSLRASRLALAVCLLFCSILIQLTLLYAIKWWIADAAVVHIRKEYDSYQKTMYGNADGDHDDHLKTIIGGQLRGLPEYFDEANFDLLSRKMQKATCNIPFSQPNYLCTILFIWSLTCVGEIKAAMYHLSVFVVGLPTVPMERMFLEKEVSPDEHNLHIIVGLPMAVKLLVVECVILPRILLSGYLLWIGCRWLSATPSLQDVLCNVVALEFVLLLKDLLYHTLVTSRNKRDLANTKVKIPEYHEFAGYISFVGTLMWGVLALAWVVFYVYHFQKVLQEYNWDVRGPCTQYMHDAHDTGR